MTFLWSLFIEDKLKFCYKNIRKDVDCYGELLRHITSAVTLPVEPFVIPGVPNTSAVAFQPLSVFNGLDELIIALPSSTNPPPVALSPRLHLAIEFISEVGIIVDALAWLFSKILSGFSNISKPFTSALFTRIIPSLTGFSCGTVKLKSQF